MSKSNHDDEDETEKMHDDIIEILYQKESGHVNAIVMGDFNSILGEASTNKVVGHFGLGKRNERGKTLIHVCKATRSGSD